MGILRSSLLPVQVLLLCVFLYTEPVHSISSSVCNTGRDSDGDKAYIQCGDFNLGALISVYDNDRKGRCLRGSIKHRRMQYVEAIAYAVNMVNSWKGFLQGYKLGFAILNDCGGDGAGNAKAMQFLPCERYVFLFIIINMYLLHVYNCEPYDHWIKIILSI